MELNYAAPDETADDAVESSKESVSSWNSNPVFKPGVMHEYTIIPKTSPTEKAKTFLTLMIQKEMSKLFAARCDATHVDLIPFKVIMDIIRQHFFLTNKPEVLRVLIRLLCQYQPLQGHTEYRKLISLCNDLLVTVDDEVRDTFLSMIPLPVDFRLTFTKPASLGCGHFIRGVTQKDGTTNPLSEMVKRPLLSYQTRPPTFFQQPY